MIEQTKEQWMTPQEVADLFQISTKTLLKWVREGRIKRQKIGKIVRYTATDVAAVKTDEDI